MSSKPGARRVKALPTVAVTTGEPAGVGPDLCTELLDQLPRGCRAVLIGDRALFGRARAEGAVATKALVVRRHGEPVALCHSMRSVLSIASGTS